MQRRPVSSSNLSSVGYDPATRTLEIEFRNGRIYQYLAVPSAVYAGLMASGSKGLFFADHIRGRYRFRQLL